MPDAAPEEDEPERGPLRRCVVTRDRMPKERMIRFVVSPDRLLVPDLAERLPGRGIWLSASRDVLETARTRGAFARAARGQVTIPPELPGLLEAVCGFAKVREWIAEGRAAVVVQASDGSPDERSRLLSGARTLPVVAVMSGTRLAASFGRDHVVHAALSRGALADRLVAESGRLAGLAGLPVPVRGTGAVEDDRASGSADG